MSGELKNKARFEIGQHRLIERVEWDEKKLEEYRAWIDSFFQEVEVIDDDDILAVREAQSMSREATGIGGPCTTGIKHPTIEIPNTYGEDTSEFVELEELTENDDSEIHRQLNQIYEDIISDW